MAAAELDTMLASIAHRGPHVDAWAEGPLGLGHRGAHPPAPTLDDPSANGVVVCGDLRLDNAEALADSLGLGGQRLSGGALVAAAWRRWGEGCAERLLGDFAFALWDAQRRELFSARDHSGVRPLYYHLSDRLFACASQPRALLVLPDVPRALDESHLVSWVIGDFDDPSSTFYSHIRRLPPAHHLTISAGRTRLQRYWSLDHGRELRLGSDAAYAEAFRETFYESVHCRLGGGPDAIGFLLSGGLDSSAIVCVARDLLGRGAKLPTFSAIFPTLAACDERPYVDAVVAGGGIVRHDVPVDGLGPLDAIDQMVAEQDQPFFAPNLFMHRALYRAARAEGVLHLFDGLDGDTTVSHGLGRLTELLATGRWLTLAREITAVGRNLGRSRWHLFRRQALAPLVPSPVRLVRHAGRPPGAGNLAASLILPDVAQRNDLADRLRRLEATRVPLPNARAAHHRALNQGLVPMALEMGDHSAAALGLEPLYPFFDRRLIELCLAMPSSQKLRGGVTRFVVRQALEGVYPTEIGRRLGKSDLSPNFMRGMTERERGWDAVVGVDRPLARYVDARAAAAALARFATISTQTDAVRLWALVVLGVWLGQASLDA